MAVNWGSDWIIWDNYHFRPTKPKASLGAGGGCALGHLGTESKWEQKESEVHKTKFSASTLEVYKQKTYKIFEEEMAENFPMLG